MKEQIENKIQEIGERITGLISWLLIKKEHFNQGLINEEQLCNCLDYADMINEEIEAEIAVLELLESVSVN
jgi:hypothetical protein